MKNFSKFALSIFAVFSFAFLMFSSDDEEDKKKEPVKVLIKVNTESEFFDWYVANWYGKPIGDFVKKYGEADRKGLHGEPVWDQLAEIPGVAGGSYLHDVSINAHEDDPKGCGRPTLCCAQKK